MISTLTLLNLNNMNESVDRSLILRDEDQHIRELLTPHYAKIAQRKRIIIAVAVLAALLLVGTFYFAFSPAAPKDVLD
jgi:hypothetical protein